MSWESSPGSSCVCSTAFTRQTFRPAGTLRDTLVTFGEAPAGSAPLIKAWFPPESSVGHEFIYSR